ncbi:hypothetical protein [Mucilaginibacter sp.]
MLKKIKELRRIQLTLPGRFSKLESDAAEQKLLTAKAVINSFDYSMDRPIADYEFKVFSQWGDDGIIQYLIKRSEISEKTFIEFGVENYTEANTRFLLLNNNWQGMIMDGSPKNLEEVKNSQLYWRYDLKIRAAFITRENINQLILESGFSKEVGILSIDIDGNDYWIWDAIDVISPVIVIVEYNSVFGQHNAWTIPYNADFVRNKAHFSNLYYGSSLLSLCDLAEKKGYFFVGCSSSGNNSYFVRKDKIGKVQPVDPENGYVLSMFKESRNEEGYLSYLAGEARLGCLHGLPIFNTRTMQTELIK